ncbi:MAG: hypothetical protein QME74_00625 [Candidatus Edwardsbacteria bacterium]|nr:hypothetical protein [Candidatus Edwardsbacteria bacterium]
MKRTTLITACCLVAAGLCLGQSDSVTTKPDSVNVTVDVQSADTDPASVTVTTEKNTTDTTVTVNINSGRRTGKRQLSRHNWVLGCRMNNLSLGSFPGMVFLQRRVKKQGFISLGLNCNVDKAGPIESYRDNTEKEKSSSESAFIQFTPGYTIYRAMRSWLSSLSIEGSVSCSFGKGERSRSRYDTVYSWQSSVYRAWSYSLTMPIALERRFRIGNMVYSAGLQASILSLYSTYSKEENTDSDLTPVTVTNTRISPIRIVFCSPFNGYASIQLKYWF